MNSTAAPEEQRRNAHLLASLALLVAFVVVSWSRLSLPFSTSEALFVHEALRASGQATSPDFETDPNPVPARVLTVIQQLVGPSERSMRLVFLLLLAVAAWVLAEIIPRPTLASALTPLLAGLALPMVGHADLIRPEMLVVLPASIVLLAAPLADRITNMRALVGLGGALVLGALSLHAAVALGGVLLLLSAFRGSILDRTTAVVTAAAGVAAGWVIHGPLDHLPVAYWGLETRMAVVAWASASLLILASAANALGPFVRWVLVVALVAAVTVPLCSADPPARQTALDVLVQARAVAQPTSGLVVEGPDRAAVAVYARLGHAPAMAIIYVPENAPLDSLAATCRANQIHQIWLHPPRAQIPAGFSAADSRPAIAPALTPLNVGAR